MKIYVVKRILTHSTMDGYVTYYSDGVAYFLSKEKAQTYVEEHADRQIKKVVYQITENGLQRIGRTFPLEKEDYLLRSDECVKIEEVVTYYHKVFEIEVKE